MSDADPSTDHARRTGWPLLSIVGVVVLTFALVSTLLIALSSYLSSRSTIEDIWVSLGRSLSAGGMQETLRYLEPAQPFASPPEDDWSGIYVAVTKSRRLPSDETDAGERTRLHAMRPPPLQQETPWTRHSPTPETPPRV